MSWLLTLHSSLAPAKIMGVLNITPDSMFDGGRFMKVRAALARSAEMVHEGADMIDIGGESTRPNATPVTAIEELQRVLPAIKAIRKRFTTIPLSIDTSQPLVMRAAIEHGVDMINDVRALRVSGALATAAALKVPICLMHMAYPFGHTTADILGDNPLVELRRFFSERIMACEQSGIAREKLIIDPGFGAGSFGKNLCQNLHILKNIHQLTEFNLPVLVGLSYKTFFSELLSIPLAQRLPGVLAATTLAVAGGVNIIRTHNVRETRQVVLLAEAVKNIA